METIKLLTAAELIAKENVPQVPDLIQQYLDLKTFKNEGDHFKIVMGGKSIDNPGHGMSYFCQLSIEQKVDDAWKEAYSTGMRCYRPGFANQRDNDDWNIHDSAIFQESEQELIYGFRTSEGNIKVCSFKDGQHKQLVVFSDRQRQKTLKRLSLLESVVNDQEAFRSYVGNSLGSGWHTSDDEMRIDQQGNAFSQYGLAGDKTDILVLLSTHYDRDMDAIVDSYQFNVWVKGVGVGTSRTFRTGLHHPGGRFYCIQIAFDSAKLAVGSRSANSTNLAMTVRNRSQNWQEQHELRIEWCGKQETDFERQTSAAMDKVVKDNQWNHPLYKPARITQSVVDNERQLAAFILFEQIDTDRLSEEGEGYLGDQYRYSVWTIKGSEAPQRIYEDHAYIRPRSKSGLTGTRGVDCTIKELKLGTAAITAVHSMDKPVEQQEWETLSFPLA